MKRSYITIIVLSIVIPVAVGILLFKPAKEVEQAAWVSYLPALNAVINTATSLLLIAGFYFIRNKNVAYHKASMISAFCLGSLFLVFYVIYHSMADSTSFGGEGWIRSVYYFLLLSHILLAIIVVPFVLFAFYFALTNRIERHKKIVKFTLPIWLYVSITGVLVYLLISPYY